jgi:hypothetical protein
MVVALTGCSSAAPDGAAPKSASTSGPAATAPTTALPSIPSTSAAPTTTSSTPAPTTTLTPGTPVEIGYRIDRRTADEATATFAADVATILQDPRGWGRAGFRFVERADAPFTIVLAEGPDVDALCLPYTTTGRYSCQNGPVVALNADRWRTATPKWTGDVATYRQYLVGHEVGHLLGMKHPKVQCPRRGRAAPLMNQQSTELNGCLPNPWPLPDEIALAARRPAELAPPPTTTTTR